MTNKRAIEMLTNMRNNYDAYGQLTGDDEITQMLDTAIEALSGESIKWHPYPQEIPTDVGEYLVTINGKVTIEDATYYEYSGTYQFDSQGVTAWAELPKPYEEGAEE